MPYTLSEAYDQAICLTYLIIRAQAKDLLLWWGRRQDVIRVIDSSLRVIFPLSCFLTKHSCLHSEWPWHGSHHNEGGTLIVILNECEGSIPVVRKSVKCHSEQERRRLSDYLLLHKVFNTKRDLKSKIKKKFIFVSQRNSEIKKIIWKKLERMIK